MSILDRYCEGLFELERVAHGRTVQMLNCIVHGGLFSTEVEFAFRPKGPLLSRRSAHAAHVHDSWPRACALSMVRMCTPKFQKPALFEFNDRLRHNGLDPVCPGCILHPSHALGSCGKPTCLSLRVPGGPWGKRTCARAPVRARSFARVVAGPSSASRWLHL